MRPITLYCGMTHITVPFILRGYNSSPPWRDPDGKLADQSWSCIAVRMFWCSLWKFSLRMKNNISLNLIIYHDIITMKLFNYCRDDCHFSTNWLWKEWYESFQNFPPTTGNVLNLTPSPKDRRSELLFQPCIRMASYS